MLASAAALGDLPVALSAEQAQSLMEAVPAFTTCQELLAETFQLASYRQDARASVLTDFYYSVLSFAQESGMTAKQTAVLVSLMKYMLFESAKNAWAVERGFSEFRTRLRAMAMAEQPVFSLADTVAVVNFAKRQLFQHFTLYQHVLGREQEVQELDQPVFVETAVAPPPLAPAMQEDEWKTQQKQLAEERAKQEEEERVAREKAEAEAEEEEMKRLLVEAEKQAVERAAREKRAQARRARELQLQRQREAEARGEKPVLDPEQIEALARSIASVELGKLKTVMQQQLEEREASLLARLAKLEEMPKGKARK